MILQVSLWIYQRIKVKEQQLYILTCFGSNLENKFSQFIHKLMCNFSGYYIFILALFSE